MCRTLTDMPDAPWMSVTEAAQLAQVSRSRIYALIDQKRLVAIEPNPAEGRHQYSIERASVLRYNADKRAKGWPKGKPRAQRASEENEDV